ncbi:hypothetical protein FHS31_001646 [Sphingomonas vulcanisoli]|uniref:Uncharacterized protein n=1 Tax=Sphingomonas vulcanisoli TaxID=1658060 RepID=A0ABX0TWP6_9SPHN|nr:hypothetical protein [Sphingomonas vulcanisoli]
MERLAQGAAASPHAKSLVRDLPISAALGWETACKV